MFLDFIRFYTDHMIMLIEEQIAEIRAFNRFYTRKMGLLNEGLLSGEFSLTEARVLFELAKGDGSTSTNLATELGLDAGYLSRILTKFETRGLLRRTPSSRDGRQVELALTRSGRKAFEPLDQESRNQIAGMLDPLAGDARQRLVGAMLIVQHLLDVNRKAPVSYVLRDPQVGDLGWIIHRQGVLYAQEYGWDESFEAMVAEIASTFAKTFNPKKERCWVAERDCHVVGSIFLVRESNSIAKLRLLYVEPCARGLGIGRRLVEECIRFARARQYRTICLWTNDVLVAARRIYEAVGFRLVKEEHHHSFGKDLIGQNWELTL
jgi:DNA-binding MarR family transcriptional regulator/GNAT superfamily N-acetyltransferase